MVVVPAGNFTMGTPPGEEVATEREREDQVRVSIATPFAVGRYAVTRGEFAAFVAATGHTTDGGCYVFNGTQWKREADRNWRSPGFTQDDRHPAVCTSWNDAKAYAAWLSSSTGKSHRLLSEAEREYVARAGSTTSFWWGMTICAAVPGTTLPTASAPAAATGTRPPRATATSASVSPERCDLLILRHSPSQKQPLEAGDES